MCVTAILMVGDDDNFKNKRFNMWSKREEREMRRYLEFNLFSNKAGFLRERDR